MLNLDRTLPVSGAARAEDPVADTTNPSSEEPEELSRPETVDEWGERFRQATPRRTGDARPEPVRHGGALPCSPSPHLLKSSEPMATTQSTPRPWVPVVYAHPRVDGSSTGSPGTDSVSDGHDAAASGDSSAWEGASVRGHVTE